jgi:cell division protein ZapA
MTDKVVNATIEILGKYYPVRCPESELASLQEAAAYLNKQMLSVQDSGKVINLERIAIITALNITSQFLQQDKKKDSLVNKINQKILQLQDKLDGAINQTKQAELMYTID